MIEGIEELQETLGADAALVCRYRSSREGLFLPQPRALQPDMMARFRRTRSSRRMAAIAARLCVLMAAVVCLASGARDAASARARC